MLLEKKKEGTIWEKIFALDSNAKEIQFKKWVSGAGLIFSVMSESL